MSSLVLILMNRNLTSTTNIAPQTSSHYVAFQLDNFLSELRHLVVTLFIVTIQSHSIEQIKA